MEVKPINKKRIVVFEVSDRETYRGDSTLSEPFKDFIRSLGFDVVNEFERNIIVGDKETVLIDGVKIDISYKKASTKGKSAYGGEWKERKDRCIEMSRSFYGNDCPIIAKIKFNEDIDRDKLVKKIEKYVQEQKDLEKSISDRKDNEAAELQRMKTHYYSNPAIASNVSRIYVSQGKVDLELEIGRVCIDAETGKFIGFIPKRIDGMTYEDVVNWRTSVAESQITVLHLCREIRRIGAVGGGFAEFAKNTHHGSVRLNEE